MEKRRSERKSVTLESNLSFDGKKYPCFIENISEHGLHLSTFSSDRLVSFVPEKTCSLEINTHSDGLTVLHCEIRWIHINKTPIHGLTYRMGIDIMKSSEQYNHFLDTLQ